MTAITRLVSALAGTGLSWPSRNMFHSIVARAAEVLFAVHEARDILATYALPEDRPWQGVVPRESVGHGVSEAPRGLLWHRYETDAEGRIRAARIVPPTSQNQARLEQWDRGPPDRQTRPGTPEPDVS